MVVIIKDFLESQKNHVDDFDAQVLLAHILGISRPQLITHPNTPLDLIQLDSATEAFARLKVGEPLPYILGHWEFFSLDFKVTSDVLIPRPETELLVEKAISFLKNNPHKRNVVDVGTGSGIIAISLAKHIRDVKITATDISKQALQVARKNSIKHGIENQIEFIECDLLPSDNESSSIVHHPLSFDFDLICANLPYIPTKILHGVEVYGKEPTLALDGGIDGLDLYRRLFKRIPDVISSRAIILLEIESTLGVQTLNLACDSFPQATIHLHQDLTGRDRLLEIIFP